jgi:hypothetical protein
MSATPAEGFEVEDLSPAGLLARAESNEAEIREREALRLRLAYQWSVLHPATAETGVETVDGPAMTILEAPESLGGDGCPDLAAFAPEAFALAVGLSPRAGAALIGDAQALRHRMPLLGKRVDALQVPAWQARRVVQQAHHLPLAAARWVDEQLARRVDGSIGPIVVDRLVAQAVAEADPEDQQAEELQAQAAWDVALTHPSPTLFAGTSQLQVTGDTPTLKSFHTLVSTVAHQLREAGDTSPLGVRKITALRIITHLAAGALTGQHQVDVSDLDPDTLQRVAAAVTRQGGKVKLIVHVDADDLEVDADGGTASAAGRIDKLGAATLARIRQWVCHSAVQILPVLNMARRDAVDAHDPPPWMRELVILRDQTCVFPSCTIDARDCDVDHENPYLPLDEGGPPGQTHPHNLAALCRRHHRAKTAGVWRYRRTLEGHYLWHGPHRSRFLRTPEGTKRI